MHLLMTRPDPGSEADPLEAALLASGHRITRAPLLSVAYLGATPSLDGAQALIATSRNGLKAVAEHLPGSAFALPLFTVGPATAALGRALGFGHVIEGAGTARELQALIQTEVRPEAGVLVHFAGDTLAYDLKGALGATGFEVRTEVVYQTETASEFPATVADTLRARGFDGVILMSPRTARVYARLARESGLSGEARSMVHFCLSDAVGRELASLEPVRLAVARLPNSQEMLALIAHEASDSS
jgi:uroporphyrinogen-III synthase